MAAVEYKDFQLSPFQPVWPSSLAYPEPPADPLAPYRSAVLEAATCPCWKCLQRLVCRDDCDRFTRYVKLGRQ